MSRLAAPLCLAVALAATLTAGVPAVQLQTPTDWKWRADGPVSVTNIDKDMPADRWFYVAMPPGWHMTTRAGVLTWHPGHTGKGVFRVQSQAFLFPGTSASEYGVFIGGRNIDSTAAPSYTAFVARRDGRIAVFTQAGSTRAMLVDWKANEAAVPQSGTEGTAKNVFAVEAGATEVVFRVNDKEVARLPKAQVVTEGTFGLRAGADLNLHISTFDVTYPLAPGR